MKLSSINSAPDEPVSHNAAAKKRIWFRNGELPPFTQIARVIVPPGEVLTAHAHDDMHELFNILEGNVRVVVDGEPHHLKSGDAVALTPGETHELSNLSNPPIVLCVVGWLTAA